MPKETKTEHPTPGRPTPGRIVMYAPRPERVQDDNTPQVAIVLGPHDRETETVWLRVLSRVTPASDYNILASQTTADDPTPGCWYWPPRV